ncbi:hypothetical protein AAF712_008546 [Marasmius tenuissimus]|uniref:Uncharacterized protein n=1 Tax=Marasmius tenuissimus TaxID=585030 RepID=A0ABR2ZTK8_9AGAR
MYHPMYMYPPDHFRLTLGSPSNELFVVAEYALNLLQRCLRSLESDGVPGITANLANIDAEVLEIKQALLEYKEGEWNCKRGAFNTEEYQGRPHEVKEYGLVLLIGHYFCGGTVGGHWVYS